MQAFLKKKLFLLAAFVLVVGISIYALYMGFLPLSPNIERRIARHNTVYMDGFSWEKMSQIKKGMTYEQVLQVMGPSGQDGAQEGVSCHVWSYRNPDSWKRFPPFAGDLLWEAVQICFDTKKVVIFSHSNGYGNIIFN